MRQQHRGFCLTRTCNIFQEAELGPLINSHCSAQGLQRRRVLDLREQDLQALLLYGLTDYQLRGGHRLLSPFQGAQPVLTQWQRNPAGRKEIRVGAQPVAQDGKTR